MTPLTPAQSRVLEFIRTSVQSRGIPPTRAEIAREFGYRSPNAAEDHLRRLAKKGAIRLMAGISRGISLTDDSTARHT